MKTENSIQFDGEQDAASYDQAAIAYNKYIERLSYPLARYAVKLTKLKNGHRILDVGTGSGIAVRHAAGIVGSAGMATGIDLSKGMVSIASEIAQKLRLTNVEFYRMDAEKLEFPDNSFDVVLSLCAPAHFPNIGSALNEMSRVLLPGHRLVVSVGSGRPPLLGFKLFHYAVWRAFMKLKGVFKPQLWAPHAIMDFTSQRVPQVPEPQQTSWSANKPYEKLVKAVSDAGFKSITTHYEGHVLTFDSAEEFWEAQEAIVTSVRKRFLTLSTEQLEVLRRDFVAMAQKTLDGGGKLYYPYGAFYVSGVKAD